MNYTYYRRYQKPRRRRKKSQFGSFFWFVVFLVILAFILKACVSVFTSVTEEKQDDIILTVERGSGETLGFGHTDWQPASDLEVIHEGDMVLSSSESYLLLTFFEGGSLRLDENTQVIFDRVDYDETGLPEIHLELIKGQVWYEQGDDAASSVVIHTDVMDVIASNQFLLSNKANNEALHVFDGPVAVDFVDRGLEDVVLESLIFNSNTKSLVTDEIERALLAREAVILNEPMEEGEFLQNQFVQWSRGETELPEPEIVEEPEIIEEEEESEVIEEEEPVVEEEPEEVEEEIESLMIQITSPSSGTSDDDGAIAIEGVISSGTAQSVYVTWSGNGQPYPLGLFEPGGSSFRYVADVNYSNFAVGENTYTVVAYDENGNASNSVSIVILGDF